MFNAESRYSLYFLIQRVTTPRIVYSGESLLTAESYFKKKFEGLLLPLKVEKELFMQSTAHEEHFKRVKNMSCLRLQYKIPPRKCDKI